jgi:hypothetical protein
MIRPRRKIGAAHGITIDCRIRERRQRKRRIDICRQNAAVRVIETDPFGFRDGGHALCNKRDSIVDRHQRAAESEAVVRELRHETLPLSRMKPDGLAGEEPPPRYTLHICIMYQAKSLNRALGVVTVNVANYGHCAPAINECDP